MQNGIHFTINKEKCLKCGVCVSCCPFMSISQIEKHEFPEIDKDLCRACGVCDAVCSAKALVKVNEKF
jgi:Pyruvate/2-oxoacid:ferredoxin oxidoreductase delta subunit